MPESSLACDYAALTVLVATAVAIASFIAVFLRRNWRRSSIGPDEEQDPHVDEEVAPLPPLETTPDRPQFFGYKTAWIAVRTGNAEEVARFFEPAELRRANWRSGVDAAWQGVRFITPSVDGWTFVIVPLHTIAPGEDITAIAEELSRRFGEAQYFHTHRIAEAHAWYLFLNGEEQRAYEYCGHSGTTDANRGPQTAGEIELGYQYFDENSPEAEADDYWERTELTWPDEGHVMEVAGKWSIDPRTLDGRDELGCGWVIARRMSAAEWDVGEVDVLDEQ